MREQVLDSHALNQVGYGGRDLAYFLRAETLEGKGKGKEIEEAAEQAEHLA